MMRFALPVLAAASTAYAACSIEATTTIQNGGDASAIATCTRFQGSIAIATGVPDDINLSGISRIEGNLVVKNNTQITAIAADDLEEIRGGLDIQGNERLSALRFGKLKKVESLTLLNLPGLQQLDFTAEINEADKIAIEGTFLSSLQGINVETASEINIANNIYISQIEMQVSNVSEALTIADNNAEVNVSFPNLIWAKDATFRSCASVSVPSLETLNGSLTLETNRFESFAAPNLTRVGGALALNRNNQATNFTFPVLTTIVRNLQLANNSALEEVTGFPELKTVRGAFDMYGNMTTIETPKLGDVAGAFNIQSQQDIGDTCDFYKDLADKKLIKGKYFCEGDLLNVGGEGSDPTSTGGDDEEGAASSLNVQNGALVIAGLAAVLLL